MSFQHLQQYDSLNGNATRLQMGYEPRYKRIVLDSDDPDMFKFLGTIKSNNTKYLPNLLNLHGNIKDVNGLTPMKIAIVNNNYDAVKIILQHLDYVMDDPSLFAVACEYCTDENGFNIINELTKCKNLNVNQKGGCVNEHPLYYLIRNNHKNGVNLLLNFNDIDINHQTNNKQTLLQYVITNGKNELIELIASHKNIQLTPENIETIFNFANNTLIEKVLSNNKLDLQNTDKLYDYYFKLVRAYAIKPNVLKYFENYVDVNHKDNSGNTVLFYVIKNNDYEKLNYFLSLPKIDLSVVNANGLSSLMYSVSKNDTEIVKKLFNHIKNYSEDVKKKLSEELTEMNETLLIIASKNNNYDIFEQIYPTLNLNVNHCDYNGYTALYYAISNSNNNIFQKLINDPNIDVNKQDLTGTSLLMHAYVKHHTDFFYQLINHKNININLQDHKGHNIFGSIIYNKYQDKQPSGLSVIPFDQYKDLKRQPSNIDGYYPAGCGPALFEQEEVTTRLQNMINSTTNHTNSMFREQSKFTNCIDNDNTIISALLKKNIDVNTYDVYNSTPLMYIIEHKNHNLFNLLLNYENLDVNFKYNNGKTYLMILFEKLVETKCDNTYLSMFLQLLNHSKLNINDTDSNGNTMLFLASGNKEVFVLNHLLKIKGINIDKQNYKKETALSNAVTNELWNHVKILLTYGANQNIDKQLTPEVSQKYTSFVYEYNSTNKSEKKGWFY